MQYTGGMPSRKPALRTSILAAGLALSLAGCGDPPGRPGANDGVPDAGDRTPDGGSLPDGGGTPDGGETASFSVTAQAPNGPRRGPIALTFAITDPGTPATFQLERRDGEDWVPATLLTNERTATGLTLVWDSFSDLAIDGDAALRLVAEDEGTTHETPLTIAVRNAPDTDRLVLVGHKLVEEGGVARPNGTAVSAVAIDGTTGAARGEVSRIDVGRGPSRIRMAPHGRAALVQLETAGTFAIVSTPLDASASGVALIEEIYAPGYVGDVRWSHDGRFVYAIVARTETEPAALLRYAIREDLGDVADPVRLATLPGPPSLIDVDRTTGALLVACGSGGEGLGKIVLYDADGTERARIEDDYAPPNALVIPPDGGRALVTADMFGYELRMLSWVDRSLTQVGATHTPTYTPYDIVFHPQRGTGGRAGLVSNLDKNRVTPIVLTESGIQFGTAISGLPLAAEMDIVERGPLAGNVFVPIVSSPPRIERLVLTSAGTVTREGTVAPLGAGAQGIPHGAGVQR